MSGGLPLDWRVITALLYYVFSILHSAAGAGTASTDKLWCNGEEVRTPLWGNLKYSC